jgi:hypothetical protein
MTDLHALIHALQPAEISYLKKHAQKSGNTNPKYMEVMDAIRAQEVYEEEALLKKFRREKFVKQFSVIKNYLFHFVTDSLIAKELLHQNENQLLLLIQRIYYFKDKGLYSLAETALKTALHLAKETEAFLPLIELLAIERYMIIHKFSTAPPLRLEQNKTETQQAVDHLQNLQSYINLHTDFLLLADKSFNFVSENRLAALTTLMQDERVIHESNAHSTRALVELLILKVQYYNVTNQSSLFFETALRSFELAHQSQWYQQFDRLRLLSTYPQLMHAALLTGQYACMHDTLKKLSEFVCTNDIQQMAVFSYKTPFLLVYLQEKSDLAALKTAIEEAYLNTKLFGKKLRFDVRANIIVSCMSGAIELGLYGQAVEWAVLFRSFDSADRLDSQMVIDMLALIAHTELTERIYVQNLSQTIYQRALRWGEKGEFESTYLSFFKKLSASLDKDEEQKLFEKTKQSIARISSTEVSSQNRTLFPIFDTYVKSKIAAIPYHLFSAKKH